MSQVFSLGRYKHQPWYVTNDSFLNHCNFCLYERRFYKSTAGTIGFDAITGVEHIPASTYFNIHVAERGGQRTYTFDAGGSVVEAAAWVKFLRDATQARFIPPFTRICLLKSPFFLQKIFIENSPFLRARLCCPREIGSNS
jgi:hypothetical protein